MLQWTQAWLLGTRIRSWKTSNDAQSERILRSRIYFYFEDHAPPHFHAFYGEHEAKVAIESLEILAGSLPTRAHALVVEWAVLRRDEMRRAWRQASIPAAIDPIDPLP